MHDLSLYTSEPFADHRRFWLAASEQLRAPWRLDDPEAAAGARRPGLDGAPGPLARVRHALSPASARLLGRIGGDDPLGQDVVVLSALWLVLSKYAHARTVALVTPPLGPRDGQAPSPSPFVALVAEVATSGSLKDWILEARRIVAASYGFQDYPLALIDPALADPARISNVMFHDDAIHLPPRATEGFDLTLSVSRGDGIALELGYRAERWARASVARLGRHLEQLLEHLHEPARPLARAALVAPDELARAWTHGPAEGPFVPATLVQLFAAQRARTPDQPAVVWGDLVLSYAELDRQSAKLAAHLGARERFRAAPRVGVALEKSPRLIVAILAVLRAGGAYVPLDPGYPAERFRALARDAELGVLLIDASAMFGVDELDAEVFVMDLELDGLPDAPPGPVDASAPESLAYLIYTSGSTGAPKGVMIEHQSIANTVRWRRRYYGLRPGHAALQFASISFDSSVEDIFTPLISGAAVVLTSARERDDLAALGRLIERARVTHLLLVPSFYQALLEQAGDALRGVLGVTVAGEACPPSLVASHHLRLPHAQLVNEYGPTENAVCSTAATLLAPAASGRRVAIGQPIDHGRICVLDPQRAPLPRGFAGQLALSGPGLARGYWRAEALTAGKFVTLGGPDGDARVYLSGDLGRLDEGGWFEFLGRIDEQIKINGVRIEPGEIEHALAGVPGVEVAIVRARTLDTGKAALIAWYQAPPSLDAATVHAHLQARLPAALVPSIVIRIDHVPRTPSGKIDAAGLPVTVAAPSAPAYVAPATPTEHALAAIWTEVLGCERVGADDHFFTLHGDSLQALRVLGQVAARLGAALEIDDLYRHPTVRALARRVHEVLERAPAADPDHAPARAELHRRIAALEARARRGAGAGDDPATWEAVYPLTAIERGMLFQSLAAPELALYHDQICFDFEDAAFDEGRFGRALALLYGVHDMLRSSYRPDASGEAAHVVHRAGSVVPELTCRDLTALGEADQRAAIEAVLRADRARPFDVARPGLLRCYVLRRSRDRHTLINASHHLILDGWSHNVLLDAVFDAYRRLAADPAYEPAPLASRFADVLVRRLTAAEVDGPAHLAFWQRELAGWSRVPLPFQRAAPAGAAVRVERHEVACEPELHRRLASLAERLRVGVKHLHVAAFATLLAVVTRSEDLTFGLVGHTRPAVPDGDRHVGNFIHSLPFRIRLDPAAAIEDVARAVCAKLTELHAHEGIGLADLARGLQQPADVRPFFDILFNYVDFAAARRASRDVVVHDTGVAAYEATDVPLDVIVSSDPERFRLFLSYHHPVYQRADMERLARIYLRIVAAMVDEPAGAIAAIEWIPPGDAARALVGPEVRLPGRGEARTVDAAFRAQAARAPDAVALVAGAEAWTYAELDARAARLAAHLVHDHQIRPGDVVAFALPRAGAIPAAILAIHRAGAAYLPLDLAYPERRSAAVLEDSGAKVVLASRAAPPALGAACPVLYVEDLEARPPAPPAPDPDDDDQRLAYLIYTSGSTGAPKGVRVTHRNVINLFLGMDRALGAEPDDALLAVTHPVFDISVLELLWTLCRGIQVVMRTDEVEPAEIHRYGQPGAAAELDFSLFFFGSLGDDPGAASADDADPYGTVLACSRYADAHGFRAVWTPERHFHRFGALFPNPAVTAAAIATCTERIELRAGSVVAALHHPARIAEEWAAVDQLSRGRAGLSFASGWHPNDFALNPEAFADRHGWMDRRIAEVRALWRGEALPLTNGRGEPVALRTYPRPRQAELPIWITAAGHPDTFRKAGALGAHLLTHVLGRDLASLGEHIALYRQALSEHGFDPRARTVTLMVHAYLGHDLGEVLRAVEAPLKAYLRSSIDLASLLDPARDGARFGDLPAERQELLLHRAFERYCREAALIGTPATCAPFVHRLHALGVDEIACLVDFGLGRAQTLASLAVLADFKEAFRRGRPAAPPRSAAHRPITMLQATPSLLAVLVQDPDARRFLGSLRKILVGGEALPGPLLRELQALPPQLYNMYGPTETTVWSTVHAFPRGADEVNIGAPIANTQIAVVDHRARPLPAEVIGEIAIGGAGVSAGYHRRPELQRARFLDDLEGRGPAYRTGDLGYVRGDGALCFLGREDHQIKLNGHRIELGEIEAQALELDGVHQAAVVLAQVAARPQLVAYLVHDAGRSLADIRRQLGERLPQALVPALMVSLAELPLGPGGKIDRAALAARALPSQEPARAARPAEAASELERALQRVWAQILGHDRFTIDDDFFAVGGYSLKLLALEASLRRELAAELTLMDLLRRPTIRGLAELLGRQPARAGGAGAQAVIPLGEVDPARPSIVVIPSSVGDPGEFQHLVPWIEGVNVLGLQLAELQRGLTGALSIEALADETDQQLARRGSAPVALVGYSLGVKLALALAARLEARRQTPALVLLDGNLARQMDVERPDLPGPDAALSRHLDALGIRAPERRREIEALIEAEARFDGVPSLAADLLCVEALDTPGVRTRMRTLRELTRGAFQLEALHTSHFALLARPSADRLGPLVRGFIAAAASASAGPS